MSLYTWKREFYPTAASKCTAKDALEHVLRKYLGTRLTALKRHGVAKIEAGLTDGRTVFWFTEKTCALCQVFQDIYRGSRICNSGCALVTKQGHTCGPHDSLYSRWVQTGDPEPMIRALRRAIKKQKAEAVSA